MSELEVQYSKGKSQSLPKIAHASKSSLSILLSQNLMSFREVPEKAKNSKAAKQIKRRNISNISSDKLYITKRSVPIGSGKNESVVVSTSVNDLRKSFSNPPVQVSNTFPTDMDTDSDENKTRQINHTQQSFSNKVGGLCKSTKYIERNSCDFSSVFYDSKFLDKYNSNELQEIFKKLVFQTEELNKSLQNRLTFLENLIDNIKPEMVQKLGYPANNFDDVSKAQEAIRLLTLTLSNSSKTEIELGSKSRELERKFLENTILSSKYKKIKLKSAELRKDLEILRENREVMQEEINHFNRLLTTEKKTNGELNKKVDVLERRLKFVLDIDMNANAPDQYKLRTSLTELMKEAENLKRELAITKKENEKLNEKCNTQDLKITRLLKKIENLKNNRENEDKKERIKLLDLSRKDGFVFFFENEIPRNLDFRVNSLKSQYSNLLSDIIEHGTSLFIQHFMKHTDPAVQKEEIGLITSQFISFKEFGERMNKLIRELANINKLINLEDLLININRNFRGVFQSENVFLWVSDQKNGLLFTFDENKQEKKCLFNKGLFGEVIRTGKPISKNDLKDKALYEPVGEESYKHRDSVLLYPIKILENRVFGILEVSNIRSDLYGFDDEYYAMLLSVFCSQILKKIMDHDLLIVERRHTNSFQEFFCSLMSSRDRFEFTEQISLWCGKLLGVQGCRFYFVEDNKLVRYLDQREEFDIKAGFVGMVASQKRATIVVDISHSSYYNKLVDIHSLLPIYAIPLTFENSKDSLEVEDPVEVKGVFEVVLKQKLKLREKHVLLDYNEINSGQVDQVNTFIETFCNYIKSALQIFDRNNKF